MQAEVQAQLAALIALRADPAAVSEVDGLAGEVLGQLMDGGSAPGHVAPRAPAAAKPLAEPPTDAEVPSLDVDAAVEAWLGPWSMARAARQARFEFQCRAEAMAGEAEPVEAAPAPAPPAAVGRAPPVEAAAAPTGAGPEAAHPAAAAAQTSSSPPPPPPPAASGAEADATGEAAREAAARQEVSRALRAIEAREARAAAEERISIMAYRMAGEPDDGAVPSPGSRFGSRLASPHRPPGNRAPSSPQPAAPAASSAEAAAPAAAARRGGRHGAGVAPRSPLEIGIPTREIIGADFLETEPAAPAAPTPPVPTPPALTPAAATAAAPAAAAPAPSPAAADGRAPLFRPGASARSLAEAGRAAEGALARALSRQRVAPRISRTDPTRVCLPPAACRPPRAARRRAPCTLELICALHTSTHPSPNEQLSIDELDLSSYDMRSLRDSRTGSLRDALKGRTRR